MKPMSATLKALTCALFIMALSSLAHAQANRTWVSGVGDDVNPCSRTAPCKTFAGAISKTANFGEISALDPGGYGALTVTKSITVNGEGTLAGNLNALTTGFIVNATSTDTVTIRFVSIKAPNNGTDGIRILQAKAVNIEEVSIEGNTGEGIEVAESTDVSVMIRNCSIRNNTGNGIKVASTGGIAKVAIDHCVITGSTNGINAGSRSRIVVRDSLITQNTIGVLSQGLTAGNGGNEAVMTLENCMIASNSSHGIQAGGGAALSQSIVRISNNEIINNGGNGISVQAAGPGIVNTLVNNKINGNGVNGCPGCTNSVGDIGE